MPTTVSEPLVEFIDGKRYFSWEVVQVEDQEGFVEHAVITGVPTFCTLTLYEMEADAAPIEYALGLEPDFVPSDTDIATIVRGPQPRAFVRNQCRVNILAPDNILVVYSGPTDNTNVTTRITVREGHE